MGRSEREDGKKEDVKERKRVRCRWERVRFFRMDRKLLYCDTMGRDGIIRDGSNRRANIVTNAGENLDLSSGNSDPGTKQTDLEQMDGWQRAEEVEIWDSSALTQSCQTNITLTFHCRVS